jgi:hypothetical protein
MRQWLGVILLKAGKKVFSLAEHDMAGFLFMNYD